MKISQLMQPEVVVARETQSLKEAAAALVAHGISGMPVCSESGQVVGVLSEADVLYKEGGRMEPRGGALAWLFEDDTAEARAKAQARTVAEAMTTPAITIGPSATAAGAARLMLEQGINRLPVVAEDGRLIGIVTRADLVRGVHPGRPRDRGRDPRRHPPARALGEPERVHGLGAGRRRGADRRARDGGAGRVAREPGRAGAGRRLGARERGP